MSMDDRKLRELLDACRPRSDDLRLPEFAALAARLESDAELRRVFATSQRWDESVQVALRNGPVPAGLASRLLAALADVPDSGRASAALEASALDVENVVDDEQAPAGTDVSSRPASRWRFWGAVAASVVGLAATLVVVVASLPSSSPVSLTEQEVCSGVTLWTAAVADRAWRVDDFPRTAFPTTRHVPLRPVRWQSVPQQRTADRVVCYDLTRAGRGQVLLFVLRTSRRLDLPGRPSRPLSDTQGLCVGAWQEQGLVYALSVEGNAKHYQELIRVKPSLASVPTAVSGQSA